LPHPHDDLTLRGYRSSNEYASDLDPTVPENFPTENYIGCRYGQVPGAAQWRDHVGPV